MFAVECGIKLVADSSSLGCLFGFFQDPWNTFDVVVLATLMVLTPLTADGTGVGAVRVLRILRLLRALRVLRAARVFPQLTLVLETLIRSIASVFYILAFLTLVAYIFAIVGVTLFGMNDPFHFGTLGRAITTLFRVATRGGWNKVMYFQLYGCDGFGDGYATYVRETAAFITKESLARDDGSMDCVHEEFPVFGRVYFAIYIFVAAMLLLNLFVGVITDSMMKMNAEMEEKLAEEKAWVVATRLKVADGEYSPRRHGTAPGNGSDGMFDSEGTGFRINNPIVSTKE
jgi:voltage-gated sodium channel